MLVSTLLIVTLGFLAWRFLTRGERGQKSDDLGALGL
jgi:hypothetical protein